MHTDVRPDPRRAAEEIAGLIATIEGAGAQISFMAPAEGLPDLVLTALPGIVDGNRFLPASFQHDQRRA